MKKTIHTISIILLGALNLTYGQTLNEGNSYYASGDFDKAIEIFTQIINNNSRIETSPVYFNRANSYFHNNEFENAIIDYTINIGRGESYVYLNRAKTFLKMGKYDKALSDIDNAIKDGKSQFHICSYWKGKILMAQGKLELALNSFNNVINYINKNEIPFKTWSAISYSAMAEIYILKGNYKDAKRCYESASKAI